MLCVIIMIITIIIIHFLFFVMAQDVLMTIINQSINMLGHSLSFLHIINNHISDQQKKVSRVVFSPTLHPDNSSVTL